MLKIKIDGCSIPNPGMTSIAVVVFWGSKPIRKYSKVIGNGTNNIGEYSACIRALQIAKQMNEKKIEIQSDSLLLIKQLIGEYKVKSENLIPLHKEIMNRIKWFDKVEFIWIPREENFIADSLAYNILKYHIKPRRYKE